MDVDSEVESMDEDEDEYEEHSLKEEASRRNVIDIALNDEVNDPMPFANEAEASKSLRNYTRKSLVVNVDKDLVLTSSGLNIIKTLLPRTLQLMTLSRGNYAFDLFL